MSSFSIPNIFSSPDILLFFYKQINVLDIKVYHCPRKTSMALSALRSAIWVPYPVASPGHGFWGEQTSTLNFCEEVGKFGCESSVFYLHVQFKD